ncbi:MAG: hypothetical protein HYZ52_06385 [Candidatus Omnitrophica bacterium]|nr:hypothetical protein [Candidatus Omnitrophota bacterium]
MRTMLGKEYLNAKRSQDLVEQYEEVIRGINGYVRYVREKKALRGRIT